MRSIFTALSIFLLAVLACAAQTQIDPINQIAWPVASGAGVPTTYCPSTTTGTLVISSVTVTGITPTGVLPGQTVTGTGVSAGTTVVAVNGGTHTVTLSQGATAGGTGVSLSFYSYGMPYVDTTSNLQYFCGSAGWSSSATLGNVVLLNPTASQTITQPTGTGLNMVGGDGVSVGGAPTGDYAIIGPTSTPDTLWQFNTKNPATALASIFSLTTIGTSGSATLTGTVLNIPQYAVIPYPAAGIPNSTGAAWGTSYGVTGSGNVVLASGASLTTPHISAATITGITAIIGPVNLTGSGTLVTVGGGSAIIQGGTSAVTVTGAGCAVSAPIGGTAAGDFTLTNGSTTACVLTVTLQAAPNGWTCAFPAAVNGSIQTATTTTTAVFTFSSTQATGTQWYQCAGY